jgi:ribosomal protein S18 acetylase RimI-like enzyme
MIRLVNSLNKLHFTEFAEYMFQEPFQKPGLCLSSFEEDLFKRSEKMLARHYYQNDQNKLAAYIRYDTMTGQIHSIAVHDKYQFQGLGKQMIIKAAQDIQQTKMSSDIWLVTNNRVFSDIFGGSFRLTRTLSKMPRYSARINDILKRSHLC